MKQLFITALIGFTSCLGISWAQEEEPEPFPPPVSLEDVDYQIQLCKQTIEEYQSRARMFDEKAQNLLSHDYMGYRNTEAMSQRCRAIADDLSKHLQQLEQQRAQMAQRQEQAKSQPSPK